MAKNKKPEFADFPEIPGNSIKEVFHKDRKYDSVYDEYKRIFQHGKSIRIEYSKPLPELLEKLVITLMNQSKYKITKNDLFQGSVIYSYGKNNVPKQRVKIITYENKKNQSKFMFQAAFKSGEIRTTLRLQKPNFIGRDKYVVISFEQLFKRENTYFGLKDEFRKRFIKKEVEFKAAILFQKLQSMKLYTKAKLPEWAVKALIKNGKHI